MFSFHKITPFHMTKIYNNSGITKKGASKLYLQFTPKGDGVGEQRRSWRYFPKKGSISTLPLFIEGNRRVSEDKQGVYSLSVDRDRFETARQLNTAKPGGSLNFAPPLTTRY